MQRQTILCHPDNLEAFQKSTDTGVIAKRAEMNLLGIPVIVSDLCPKWERKWTPPVDRFIEYEPEDAKLFTMADHEGKGIGPGEFEYERTFFAMPDPFAHPLMPFMDVSITTNPQTYNKIANKPLSTRDIPTTEKLFRSLETIERRFWRKKHEFLTRHS